MAVPNATPAGFLQRSEVRTREARSVTIVAARGRRTVVRRPGCAEEFVATGLTSRAPGESVTAITRLDDGGLPVRGEAIILDEQGIRQGGNAAFQETPVLLDVAPLTLTAADPGVMEPDTTVPVLFVLLGAQEDPLDVIVPTLPEDATQPDPFATVANLTWEPNPTAFGVAAGFDAIRGDVTLSADAEIGWVVHFVVRRAEA